MKKNVISNFALVLCLSGLVASSYANLKDTWGTIQVKTSATTPVFIELYQTKDAKGTPSTPGDKYCYRTPTALGPGQVLQYYPGGCIYNIDRIVILDANGGRQPYLSETIINLDAENKPSTYMPETCSGSVMLDEVMPWYKLTGFSSNCQHSH